MNDRVYYSRDAEVRAQRERAATVTIFLALGLGIGAVLALMFAPKSGDKTRAELASTLGDNMDPVREATSKAVKNLEKDFADLRKKVEDRINEK